MAKTVTPSIRYTDSAHGMDQFSTRRRSNLERQIANVEPHDIGFAFKIVAPYLFIDLFAESKNLAAGWRISKSSKSYSWAESSDLAPRFTSRVATNQGRGPWNLRTSLLPAVERRRRP